MNSAEFSQLNQFVTYAQKQFHLPWLAGSFADSRPQPEIPSRAVWLSLVLGEVVHIPSFLQLEQETQLPQWQQWVEECLLPMVYWDHQVARTRCRRRKAKIQQAWHKMRTAFDQHASTQRLAASLAGKSPATWPR